MPVPRLLAAFRALFGVSPATAKTASPCVTAGSNAFGIDLYQALRRRNGNLFFSPLNISTALSMAASGARGETAAEMRRVLRLAPPPNQVDADLGRALHSMTLERRNAQLHIANALWLAPDLVLDPRYRRSMTDNYEGALQRVDFAADPEAARIAINLWVESHTAGKIRSLIRGIDGPRVKMLIVAALYAKADWARPFARRNTADGDFHTASGSPARAPLMSAPRARLRHLSGDGFQAVAIPYRDEELSMVVFLPNTADGLQAFEQDLSASSLQSWLDALNAQPPQAVRLTLPRFKLDDRFDLKAALQGLGMRRAFSDRADFSRISRAAPLWIDGAIHQSSLAVDEEGTEAAAATTIRVTPTSATSGRSVEFRADHPFFFLVRDEPSGAILFMGRLQEPAA